VLAIVASVAALTSACSHSNGGASAKGSGSSDPRCASKAKPSTGSDNTDNGHMPAVSSTAKNFGQDAKNPCLYVGSGDFSFDVSKCPSGWDINQGITDTSINLFTSSPHSGPLAVVGGISDGMKAYFNYVNAHGGIFGRKINLTIMDDQYQPDLLQKNVQSAVDSKKYAGAFGLLNSAGILATRDYMNKQCMGENLNTATDAFFDPGKYPWTSGFGLNSYSEMGILASEIDREFPNGAKVALIATSSAQGDTNLAGFQFALKSHPNIKIVTTQRNDETAPNMNDQITSAAATKADAVLLIEAGTGCIQGIEGIQKSSWKPKIFVNNSCAQVGSVYQPLLKDGATGNGVEVVRYYFSPNDVDVANKDFAQFQKDTIKAAGLDPADDQVNNGWFWGWYATQVLKDASTMKGGLNRATINLAAKQYVSAWPMQAPGVKASTNGTQDAYPFESGQVYQYTGAKTPSTLGHFQPVGSLIDNDGKLGNYSKLTGK
jgi:branched-chain amino acid transport system substrate-binding protein